MLQTARHSRQIRLAQVGLEGQRRLAESSVLVIGAGGLGAPVLRLLAGAGVGTIGIADFDRVDISNLHRQTLYEMNDLGSRKIDAAGARISSVDAGIEIKTHDLRVDFENADGLVRDYDLVVDGSDTFDTRYAVNRACVAASVPVVFASVSGFSGQVAVFGSENGPCYQCLFPEPPPPDAVPSCDSGGVLGPVPAILGAVQATEALKLLLEIGDPLVGRVLVMDALSMQFRELTIERDPSCPTCGGLSRPTLRQWQSHEITIGDLTVRLDAGEPVVMLDVREVDERAHGVLPGPAIPLGQLRARLDELDSYRDRMIVAYCRSGARSSQAARLLREFDHDAVSLVGGFEAARHLQV